MRGKHKLGVRDDRMIGIEARKRGPMTFWERAKTETRAGSGLARAHEQGLTLDMLSDYLRPKRGRSLESTSCFCQTESLRGKGDARASSEQSIYCQCTSNCYQVAKSTDSTAPCEIRCTAHDP